MCYVDDLLAALRGTEDDRDLFAAIMVLVWEAVGFQLPHTCQLDKEITWIVGTLRCEQHGVRSWIKEAIITNIMDDLINFLGKNVTPLEELQTLIGKFWACSWPLDYNAAILEASLGSFIRS